MRRLPICCFESLKDQFNFGRYNGLSLADVLDINPSYLSWCIKHCSGVVLRVYNKTIEQIKTVYPDFIMDALFESMRIWNLNRSLYEESDDFDFYNSGDHAYNDTPIYDRYEGSWAQDVEGYSDDDIDTIFDGDPSAYWNID